jgi:hypothetical protein
MYHEPVRSTAPTTRSQKAQKKDPLKQVLRSYFPMQEEKDHRVYGAAGRPSAATCSARCRSAGWSGRSCSCRSSRCRRSPRRGRCRCCSGPFQPGAAQRPGDPDDRRGTALDDPAEPQAPVHEQLHRPAGFNRACAGFQTTTAGRSAGSSPRRSSPVTRSPRRAST